MEFAGEETFGAPHACRDSERDAVHYPFVIAPIVGGVGRSDTGEGDREHSRDHDEKATKRSREHRSAPYVPPDIEVQAHAESVTLCLPWRCGLSHSAKEGWERDAALCIPPVGFTVSKPGAKFASDEQRYAQRMK
jgi:hypothetical protein